MMNLENTEFGKPIYLENLKKYMVEIYSNGTSKNKPKFLRLLFNSDNTYFFDSLEESQIYADLNGIPLAQSLDTYSGAKPENGTSKHWKWADWILLKNGHKFKTHEDYF